ncbi:MAG: hypothetical protein R3B13_28225 [Polyangiaceae bacterium]
MNRFADHTSLREPHDLTFLARNPYVYHCHHFNLFHDQTIDDVMGEEAGYQRRARAARNAYRPILRGLFERMGASTVPEKLELAQSLFSAMGHGRVSLEAGEGREHGTGSFLHYGFAWREKYGERIRRQDPIDAVAAGYLAALAELAAADGKPRAVKETECVAAKASYCHFDISPRAAVPEDRDCPDEGEIEAFLPASEGGRDEQEVGAIADGLQGFVRGVAGDDRGLVQAFNVFVTQHAAGYYNETAFAAVRHVEATAPAVVGACEDLLREAGHVCVFNTFGGILLSPEWEGMVGPLSGQPYDIAKFCTAIARGLGFGRWSMTEFSDERMVLRTTSNYEAAHWLARFGRAEKSRCYFYQGAALAIKVLAHRVAWGERPTFTQKLYDDLFRGSGLGYRIETPRCLTRGDSVTEVVVSAT